MELIPGLPHDLSRECLVRVPYDQFSTISSVCKPWKSELGSPEFYLFRKQICKTQKLIVLCDVIWGRTHKAMPPLELTVLDPETGVCFRLPPFPYLPNPPLAFSEVVSCKSGFVLLVSFENTWQSDIHVFVFDFLSNKWRRGSKLSGWDPIFDGCTSDGDHMVCLLCSKHPMNNSGTKLRSIVAYDTVKDNWTILCEISCYGEYRVYFHQGKIHMACQKNVGERPTWTSFDVSTLQWKQSQPKFLKQGELQGVICDDEGEWYACSDGNVLVLRGSTWKAIAKVPSEVRDVKFVTVWKRKLVVLGCESLGYDAKAYELDLKNQQWKRIETTGDLGNIVSACSIHV